MLYDVFFAYVIFIFPPAGVFSDLRQLDFLSLRKNRLSTLRPGVFDNQAQLTVLELTANKITTVSTRAGTATVPSAPQILLSASTKPHFNFSINIWTNNGLILGRGRGRELGARSRKQEAERGQEAQNLDGRDGLHVLR